MSITYPLNPPTSPGPATVSFAPLEIIASTRSPFSGAQQYQRWPGQLWQAHVELPPIKSRPIAEQWIAWMLAQRGGYGTFTMGQSPETCLMGAGGGNPLVNGAHASGVETLATKGWSPGIVGLLKAGDLLQLGTGSSARLHKVLVDANSDSDGEATLDIWPRLRSSYSDGAAITTDAPVGLFRLTTGGDATAGWTVDNMRMYGVVFDCIEALSV